MAVLRFVLYQALMRLAKLFIDRQVARHAETIFMLLDRRLAASFAAAPDVAVTDAIKSAILDATGASSVSARQIEQVRNLFDPVAFAARRAR